MNIEKITGILSRESGHMILFDNAIKKGCTRAN